MQRLFIIALAIPVVVGGFLGAYLCVSLWPFLNIIGKFTAGLVMFLIVCAGCYAGAWTWTKISMLNSERIHKQLNARVVAWNEYMVYLYPNGTFEHLSAKHEAAKVPLQLNPPQEEQSKYTEEEIIEWNKKGVSLRQLEEITGMKYWKLQKICESK